MQKPEGISLMLVELGALFCFTHLIAFIVFAFIRILTGVSIQRLGYFSLRHISFTLRSGVQVDIRRIQITVHRPAFSRPSWISLVVADSSLYFDAIDDSVLSPQQASSSSQTSPPVSSSDSKADKSPKLNPVDETLIRLSRLIRTIHRFVPYIRLVDLSIRNTSLIAEDLGTITIRSIGLHADVINLDSKLPHFFSAAPEHSSNEDVMAVSWRFTIKDVFYAEDKMQAEEVLDLFQFDIHELFNKRTFHTIGASLNVGVGNLTVPYDKALILRNRLKNRRLRTLQRYGTSKSTTVGTEGYPSFAKERVDAAYSLLNILREVRVHAAKVGVYRFNPSSNCGNTVRPVTFSLSTKDFTIDLKRLNSNSPGHRMYFANDDVSHQAILTTISAVVLLDDPISGKEDELVYIPMITMASTTNFVRKTVQIFTKEVTDRNSSLLKASFTISSPSIDLHARHLPIFATMVQRSSVEPNNKPAIEGRKLQIGQLLPKTIIKLSIEEPAGRILVSGDEAEEMGLPNSEYSDSKANRTLASSCSIINCEFESSHSTTPSPHYGVVMSFRVADFVTWVRSYDGRRHDLVKTDTLALKFIAETSPGFDVAISGSLASFSVCLTRPEIINSLKDLVKHARKEVEHSEKKLEKTLAKPTTLAKNGSRTNILRQLPSWLSHVKIEGSDVVLSSSFLDENAKNARNISRGSAVQIESWILEYKPQVSPKHLTNTKRHHHSDSSFSSPSLHESASGEFLHAMGHDTYHSKPLNLRGSGRRRLAIGLCGLEMCALDENDRLDQITPIITIPDIEMALSTYFEGSTPITDLSVLMKKAIFNYSILSHYSVLSSGKALKRIFGYTGTPKLPNQPKTEPIQSTVKETLHLDIRTHVIRVKAALPDSPLLMLEAVGLDCVKHSAGPPIVRSRYMRLFVHSPTVVDAWERLIVIRHFKLELKGEKVSGENSGVKTEELEDDISIDADAFSVSIPYGLVLYQLFEGIVNTFKCLKQVHHQFQTDTDEYILTPVAKRPNILPRIRIRPKVFEMRLDDDPFEARLALIFRAGLLEMNSRLAREAAFEAKLHTLKTAKAEPTMQSEAASDLPAQSDGDKAENPQTEHAEQSEKSDRAEPEIAPLHKKGTFRSMKSGMRHKHGRSKRSGVTPIRYSPTDAELPSNSAKISTEEAYVKVLELHSQSWIRRITKARSARATTTDVRRVRLVGTDLVDRDTTSSERIIAIPDYPPLFQLLFDEADILIDKPSFPMVELPQFMHDIGKGLPLDTKFTLLIPLYLQLRLSEARLNMRDYPLPSIRIPPMSASQGSKGPTWTLSSNFVIAEEIFDEKSSRYVDIPVVVAPEGSTVEPYTVVVTRTVSPVKMYSKIDVDILTSSPTLITWAPSLQPAMQQVMAIFDTFTKPPVDPSEKIGFWDKIGLIFHSRLRFSWKEGAVHLLLKGSRDPYEITKNGAGFAMCWRNNVVFEINPTDDKKQFMIVDADEYLLTIPDFTDVVRANENNLSITEDSKSAISQSYEADRAEFQKIVMKLSGHVRWQAGLLFERDAGEHRTFEFVPHYRVQLRTPRSIDKSKPHDSYAGFRSNYLHLALSVVSPHDQKWSPLKTKAPQSSYNTIHLTPKVFAHFFEWWNLFAGEMSLPIRNGALFSPQSVSKKFGRHLATIKYQLILAPLFISHMYLHKRDDDWSKMVINSVGIKARTESFMFDIHQRREVTTYTDKVLNIARRRRNMKINEAEVDFHMADIRVVTAAFKERSAEELFKELSQVEESEVESPSGSTSSTPLFAKFKVPNNDLTWIDMDDLTELDSLVSSKNLSSVKVLPWLYTPRFTYYRQTEHTSVVGATDSVKSSFGNEPSHNCLLGQTDTIRTQTDLISERARELEEQVKMSNENLVDLQRQARLYTESTVIRQKFMNAKKEAAILQSKKHTLHELWAALLASSSVTDSKIDLDGVGSSMFAGDKLENTSSQPLRALEDDHFSDFNNRFIFHNVQVKWTNAIRNVFLRYIQQVGRRRGLVYYMSRRAVKFIEDLVKEQQKGESGLGDGDIDGVQESNVENVNVPEVKTELEEIEEKVLPKVEMKSREEQQKQATEDMIEKLLQDSENHFFVPDEKGYATSSKSHHQSSNNSRLESMSSSSLKVPPVTGASGSTLSSKEGSSKSNSRQPSMINESDDDDSSSSSDEMDGDDDDPITDDALKNLADEYLARSSYMVRLLGPQIQLQSEVNANSTVLVTSQNIELKVISIMDKSEIDDEVSGLVQSRYCANLDNAQFFVFHKETMVRQSQWLFASNAYGSSRLYTGVPLNHPPTSSNASVDKLLASTSIWPPWVPLESIYDGGPLALSQIADKTSASLLYEKHNSLRLKVGDKVDKSKAGKRQSSDSARQVDKLSVDFPKFVASCDSLQYYAVYIIVMDLLIYSEPHHKKSSERLEKIMLATDFSDLSGASEMVENLQREIRQLEEIRYQFQLYTSVLDEQGWRDRRNVVVELEYAREELFFIMKAITAGQRRLEDREAQTTGVLQWFISGQQVIAHLLLEDRTPFVDLALAKGTFRRLENSDGSNFNTIEIGMLQAINLLKGALYPELLSPYFEGMSKADRKKNAIRVYWYMLESIGGIPVMDHFEADLIPLKIQLEYDIGQKLFKYIFPDEQKSPLMVYDPPLVVEGNLQNGSDSPNVLITPATMAMDSSDSSDSGGSDAASMRSGRSVHLFGKKSEEKLPRPGNNKSWTARRNTNSSSSHPHLAANPRDPIPRPGDNASVRSFVSVQSGDSKMQQMISSVGVRGQSAEHYGVEDDLTTMVDRASNYITFVYVTIPSVELCISYRGRGSRNIEDVHEFVFRLPTIEYRNKTWSNLDLALRLKKDFIKALISHTGALIENKIKSIGSSSKKRPSHPLLIRQITDYASFTSLADLSEANVTKTKSNSKKSS